ncbi:MAG: helix-turn-helix transcriptional regulator [Rhizobiales bacterium]|nr:XRE family transcriptional regulator [Hyphomicrobiales bacterium]NRB15494.1 helix-turn-helix transcriptional regulator [Hyphomicrobiales bacterium]
MISKAKRISLAAAEGAALGEKLRVRRRALGMTLKQVADQAGLTVGFISQIERNITAPSLSSLVSVAQVLEMNVSDFLSQPKGDGSITRHDERPEYSVGNSTMTYERLSSNFSGNVLRSLIIKEPPGHKAEPISHDGEEMIFMLSGEITVELNGVQTILETGDSLHFPSTQVHSTWNHTDATSTFLWAGTMDVFGDGGFDPDPIHRKLALVEDTDLNNEEAN